MLYLEPPLYMGLMVDPDIALVMVAWWRGGLMGFKVLAVDFVCVERAT